MQVFKFNANVVSSPEARPLILKRNFIPEPFCTILDATVILCGKPFPHIFETDVL